jgi:hypothetical protein
MEIEYFSSKSELANFDFIKINIKKYIKLNAKSIIDKKCLKVTHSETVNYFFFYDKC